MRKGRVAAAPHLLWDAPPPDALVLSVDDVHVWKAALDQPVSSVQRLIHTLSVDERVRAGRFSFEADREHFMVGRGILRAILGCYLGAEPDRLQFCYEGYGKPALAPGSGGEALRFNVAHSHGLALYAVTRTRKVGVDLERVRPLEEATHIAERFFSTREHAVLNALPAGSRLGAFLHGWTRKEAYLKACGDGLGRPLDWIEVSLAPEPARLLSVKGDPQEASRWSLQELAPAPGYVAALAVEGYGWRLACWRWAAEPGTNGRRSSPAT